MDLRIPSPPEVGWLMGRLLRMTATRRKVLQALGVSEPRLSNLLAELEAGRRLPAERARLLVAPLRLLMPDSEIELLARQIGEEPALPEACLPPEDTEDVLLLLRQRCRAVPFLEPLPADRAPPQAVPLYLDPAGMAAFVRALQARAVDEPSLDTAEMGLHLAHLAERAGAWVSMGMALRVVWEVLRQAPSQPRRGSENRVQVLHLILGWLNSQAVLAYNLEDLGRAWELLMFAEGFLEASAWAGPPLPEDFRWAWQIRLQLNQAFCLVSIRKARECLEGLPGRPPRPDWHPDPCGLARNFSIYADAAYLTVALRADIRPRDLRERIRRLEEAFREEDLPPALRAAVGRKAAMGWNTLGEPDRALNLASETIRLGKQFRLASQVQKTLRRFPELGEGKFEPEFRPRPRSPAMI